MGNQNWFLVLTALFFNLMFYQNTPGVNYFIFTVFVIVVFAMQKPKLLNQLNFLCFAGGTFLISTMALVHGNLLSAISLWLSICILSGFYINLQGSPFVNLTNTLYSATIVSKRTLKTILYPPIFSKTFLSNNKSTIVNRARSTLFYGTPVFVCSIFLLLYMNTSPVFSHYVNKIEINFLTLEWVAFTLFGLWVVYIIFYQQSAKKLVYFEGNPEKEKGWLKFMNLRIRKLLSSEYEITSGIFLIIALNTLLLFVNSIEMYHLFITGELPAGMSKATYVHQGIGNLIFSIILVILIIVFFFRHTVSENTFSGLFKYVAYCWIIQNILLVVFTGMRNHLYIEEFSLTYQRIGVYVYLLMAASGLLITLIKVMFSKRIWFIICKFGYACYIALILSTFINWDVYITNYNIKQAREKNETIDLEYLLSLSNANIPELIELKEESSTNYRLSVREYNKKSSETYNEALKNKTKGFLIQHKKSAWPSWSLQNHRILRNIETFENDYHQGSRVGTYFSPVLIKTQLLPSLIK